MGRTLVCSATNASMAGPNAPPMRLARPDRGISSLFRASKKAKVEVKAEVAAVVWLRAAVRPAASGRRWPCCRAVDWHAGQLMRANRGIMVVGSTVAGGRVVRGEKWRVVV